MSGEHKDFRPRNLGHAKDAADARSNLVVFYGVIGLLENGTITSAGDRDAQRIIKICKGAAQKQLRRMDRALEAIRDDL